MEFIEQEFVSYEIAVQMKELGFDELCFGVFFPSDKSFIDIKFKNSQQEVVISAPTYSQCFRWFREKYNIYAIILPSYTDNKVVKDRFFYEIVKNKKLKQELDYHSTYEEAETECLKKLIELCQNQI